MCRVVEAKFISRLWAGWLYRLCKHRTFPYRKKDSPAVPRLQRLGNTGRQHWSVKEIENDPSLPAIVCDTSGHTAQRSSRMGYATIFKRKCHHDRLLGSLGGSRKPVQMFGFTSWLGRQLAGRFGRAVGCDFSKVQKAYNLWSWNYDNFLPAWGFPLAFPHFIFLLLLLRISLCTFHQVLFVLLPFLLFWKPVACRSLPYQDYSIQLSPFASQHPPTLSCSHWLTLFLDFSVSVVSCLVSFATDSPLRVHFCSIFVPACFFSCSALSDHPEWHRFLACYCSFCPSLGTTRVTDLLFAVSISHRSSGTGNIQQPNMCTVLESIFGWNHNLSA